MPEPITHTSVVLGTLSGVIAFVFDVPAPVVFAAFAGSCFAIALAESTTLLTAILMAAGGTFAASYVTPWVSHFFDGYTIRGIAALTAFLLVHFKDIVLTSLKDLVTLIFASLKDVVIAAKDRAVKFVGGDKK